MLAQRFRRQADAMERGGRSPLYVALIRAAADDIEAGGVVARLFEGIDTPPGSVPSLRLMGALHYLALSGRGSLSLADIDEHFDEIHARLHRTVQTNDVGRSAVLYAALLWLVDRHETPIRLHEIGASAGLNLLADRYCYVVGAAELGDPASAVRLVEPWERGPDVDLGAAAARLRIVSRAGCDLAPLDPRSIDDRLTLMSYIWPDEPERLERTRAALELAAHDPPPVARSGAADSFRSLGPPPAGTLTVIWQSVFRQYLSDEEWGELEAAQPDGAVWLRMEPTDDEAADAELTICERRGEPPRRLALCSFHGAPVVWER
jgi:hypothetical protein